jgi:hypothetical protein|tara:strand:+ start:417 stop:707 length:291 start_codon:yes stop_codon:yes gene_type:complete
MTMTTLDGTAARLDEMRVAEPIEIRLTSRSGSLVLALWVDGHGIIRTSLDNGRGGASQSISNLQLTEIMPKKAVPGWQAEAVAAAGSGLYEIGLLR